MFAVNLMNESKDSTYTDIVSDLKTFSIYNNEESKNAITAIMEIFENSKKWQYSSGAIHKKSSCNMEKLFT